MNKEQNLYNQPIYSIPNIEESINSKFLIKSNNEPFNLLILLNEEKVENIIKLTPNSS